MLLPKGLAYQPLDAIAPYGSFEHLLRHNQPEAWVRQIVLASKNEHAIGTCAYGLLEYLVVILGR